MLYYSVLVKDPKQIQPDLLEDICHKTMPTSTERPWPVVYTRSCMRWSCSPSSACSRLVQMIPNVLNWMYFHCLRLFLTNISRCIKEKKNFFCGLSSFVFTEVRHLPSGCARKSCCWWAGNDSLWAATRKASSRRPATCQNYHWVGQKLSERGFMHTLTLSHCCRRACPPPSLLPPRRSLHFDILPLRLE